MWRIDFELLGFYRYDSDCWGFNILTVTVTGKCLLGLNSDEDGVYLTALWCGELKVKNKNRRVEG